MTGFHLNRRRTQTGVAAVEFALIAGVFFSLLIGIMEMGRLLFYWNTATEATRLGARIAVVCNVADTMVKQKMTALFPVVPSERIDVLYSPTGCLDADSCYEVTVRIKPVPISTVIPFVPLTLSLPPFSTTLPNESLASNAKDGTQNPMCTLTP